MGNQITHIPSQFQLLTACANPDILSRSCAVIENIEKFLKLILLFLKKFICGYYKESNHLNIKRKKLTSSEIHHPEKTN